MSFTPKSDFLAVIMERGYYADCTDPEGLDAALLAVFGVQHSVMARDGFKRAWTRVVPHVVERSVYVLLSSALLALLVWRWRAIPGVVWSVDPGTGESAVRALFWIGLVVAAVVLAIGWRAPAGRR